jgi:hypothetical protein
MIVLLLAFMTLICDFCLICETVFPIMMVLLLAFMTLVCDFCMICEIIALNSNRHILTKRNGFTTAPLGKAESSLST